MNLKFTFQADITDEQIAICYDYYCPPSKNNFDLLNHIVTVCQAYQITIKELASTIKKSQVYDPTICCKKCNIMLKLEHPLLKYINKDFNYVCQNCIEFTASLQSTSHWFIKALAQKNIPTRQDGRSVRICEFGEMINQKTQHNSKLLTNIYPYHNSHLGTPQELSDKKGDSVWLSYDSPWLVANE